MEYLREQLKKINIDIDDNTLKKFKRYYDLLIEWNAKFNLTSITEWNDVVIKHFIDSILPHNLIAKNSKVIDIGSGAGFPAIPLKLIRDDLNVTMIDSLNKRVNFLNEAIKDLGFAAITAEHHRAEDLKEGYKENYDVCVARAVAPLNILCEYCLPFVKADGIFIAYKTNDCEEELNQAKNAIKTLNSKIVKVETINIPDTDITRSFIVIEKVGKCLDIYPRGGNKPRTNPL